jgi:hypothetical protein
MPDHGCKMPFLSIKRIAGTIFLLAFPKNRKPHKSNDFCGFDIAWAGGINFSFQRVSANKKGADFIRAFHHL